LRGDPKKSQDFFSQDFTSIGGKKSRDTQILRKVNLAILQA